MGPSSALSSPWLNSHPLELLSRKRQRAISKKQDDEGDSTAEATDQDHSENSAQTTSAERPEDGRKRQQGWDEACGGRSDMGWLEMRKRLRERPTPNTGYNPEASTGCAPIAAVETAATRR